MLGPHDFRRLRLVLSASLMPRTPLTTRRRGGVRSFDRHRTELSSLRRGKALETLGGEAGG